MSGANRFVEVLRTSQVQILADWMKNLRAASSGRHAAISEQELQAQCQEFISLFADALSSGELANIDGESWRATKDFLAGISRSRGRQGFSPSETATFVLSFKESLF